MMSFLCYSTVEKTLGIHFSGNVNNVIVDPTCGLCSLICVFAYSIRSTYTPLIVLLFYSGKDQFNPKLTLIVMHVPVSIPEI